MPLRILARFILNKKIGVGQPKVIENAKILIANTAMDTDKIKIYGSRVRVDSMNKARRPNRREEKNVNALRQWSNHPLPFSAKQRHRTK